MRLETSGKDRKPKTANDSRPDSLQSGPTFLRSKKNPLK